MLSSKSILVVFVSCLFMGINILAQGNQFDICPWVSCANNGVCQPAENTTAGFRCRCQFGFTGLLCEDRVNITTCVTNPCLNGGNCTINANRQVVCTCPTRFTGSRCEATLTNQTG